MVDTTMTATVDTRCGCPLWPSTMNLYSGIGWRHTVCAARLSGMTEPTAQSERVQDEAWKALLNAVVTAAPRADPEGIKELAEAYELLMHHA